MNPELEAAENAMREQARAERLLEVRDEDLRKIESVGLSGFNVPLDLVYALCRECLRLRQEMEELKKRFASR